MTERFKMSFENKNIFITGSNRGIGLALAEKAASLKMNVHLLVRKKDTSIEKSLLDKGALSVRTWDIDMLQPESINRFIAALTESNIKPDYFVNNAGLLTGGLLEEQEVDKIYQMFQVNLVGLIHMTRLLLPIMLKNKSGKIINNASVSGLMYLPCASTYAASKAGVIAFTESLRQELEGTGVSTLVMVTPGVKTRMYDEIPDLYSTHLDLKFLSSIPAEDWANLVFEAIEDDRAIRWPQGRSKIGVKMGQHFPKLLARVVKPYFRR